MRKDLFITLVVNEVDIRGYAVKGICCMYQQSKEYYRINMLVKDYKSCLLIQSKLVIYTHTNNSSHPYLEKIRMLPLVLLRMVAE